MQPAKHKSVVSSPESAQRMAAFQCMVVHRAREGEIESGRERVGEGRSPGLSAAQLWHQVRASRNDIIYALRLLA